MKKIFLVLLVLLAALIAAAWYLRYDILRFSADIVLKRTVPGNVAIERIVVDPSLSKVDVYGLMIGNPPGFSDTLFADVAVLTVKYRMRGKTVLSGLDITGLELTDPVVNIERLSNGKINLNAIKMAPPGGDAARLPEFEIKMPAGSVETGPGTGVVKKISEAVNISGRIPVALKNGRVFFLDRMAGREPFRIAFEGINSDIGLFLDDGYEILSLATEGSGFVAGDPSQRVNWRISADLASEEITMSNRIEPENVDIVLFKPYYDQYSPVDIKNGRVSGTVIFDLHDGNIGSDNTLRLRSLVFTERDTRHASMFWDTSITDLVKYLELSSGETVFDFKIKGPLENPRFYPGAHVSRAIRNLAVDTISGVIRGAAERGREPDTLPEQPAGPGTDQEIMRDVIQRLLGK